MNSKSKWCQDMEYPHDEPSEERTGNQIFIGGLPLDTTEADLTELFLLTLGCAPEVRIMRFRDGRSRGFGFVQFWAREEYQRALEVQSYFLKGTWVQCRASVALDEAARQAKELQKRKLIVVGISASIVEDDLVNHFAVFGAVIRAKIFRVSTNTVPFAQGYVEFASKTSINKTLENLHRPKVIAVNSIPILIYSAEAKSSSTKNWKELFKAQYRNSHLRYPFFGSEKSVGLSQKTSDPALVQEKGPQEFQNAGQEAALRRTLQFSKSSSKFTEGNYRLNLPRRDCSVVQEVKLQDNFHTIVWKSLDIPGMIGPLELSLCVIPRERETLLTSQRTLRFKYIK